MPVIVLNIFISVFLISPFVSAVSALYQLPISSQCSFLTLHSKISEFFPIVRYRRSEVICNLESTDLSRTAVVF